MRGMLARIKKKQEVKYIGLLVIVMVVQAIRYFPFKFGGWNQIQLSLNYSYGFVQRAFLGTVLDVCSKVFHIPWGYMRYLYGIGTMLIFTILILGIFHKALQMNTSNHVKKSFFYGMALLFFIGPGWNTYYSNFALTDIWLPILSIVGVYFIVKNKGIWMALVVSAICILIHPAYVFLYFNFILVTLAYKVFIQDKSWDKKHIMWSAFVFIFNSMLFLYMMFFARAKEGVTIEHVMERTAEFVSKSVEEIANHEPTIAGYLFREGSVTGVQFVIQEYWLIFVVMLILFSPFIYEVYRYWRALVIHAKEGKERNWWMYALIPFGIITTVPMYIMHNDYGRWTYAVFFYEFAMIWMLNMINDEGADYATRALMKRIVSNRGYYVVLLFYATVLGAFEQNLVSSLISTVETYGWKVLEIVGIH